MSVPKVREAERAYTIAEVAALKGVSPDYVRAAMRRTAGNVLLAKNIAKPGSKKPNYRISASAVEAWWAGLEDA